MACVPIDVERALKNYYLPSGPVVGGGPFVQGTIFSRGRGLGSIIRSAIRIAAPLAKKVGRALKPVAKKVGKYAVKKGVETAADVAVDVLSGTPIKDALIYNGKVALENARYDAVQKVKTLKRKINPPPKSKKVKHRVSRAFLYK